MLKCVVEQRGVSRIYTLITKIRSSDVVAELAELYGPVGVRTQTAGEDIRV